MQWIKGSLLLVNYYNNTKKKLLSMKILYSSIFITPKVIHIQEN